jgi:hypothetical protein
MLFRASSAVSNRPGLDAKSFAAVILADLSTTFFSKNYWKNLQVVLPAISAHFPRAMRDG